VRYLKRGGICRPFFLAQALWIVITLLSACCAEAQAAHGPTLRIATFNASLNRSAAGQFKFDLSTPFNTQARAIAQIIQRVRPDVLLINEFDYDPQGISDVLFAKNYLAIAQGDTEPINYKEHYSAAVNTGVPSGLDLNNDGRVGGANDALGFGLFPGQYGLIVYSNLLIDHNTVRSFKNFKWSAMPGAVIPKDYYSALALQELPLSSKSHWDLPLKLETSAGTQILHFLVSHPTPPSFDGPEDRNGRRNHDEIRLWADYIDPKRAGYLIDDQGKQGGLASDDLFVIAGDMNADPFDGGSFKYAIRQLLDHPRVNREGAFGTFTPSSQGGTQFSAQQGGANAMHQGLPKFDTSDFNDRGVDAPGNLRVDYVLPSTQITICDSGVYWPKNDEKNVSDHHLVWVDIALAGGTCL